MVTNFSAAIMWAAAALLLLPTPIQARYKGFSLGSNHAVTGNCKTVGDWIDDMNAIKGWDRQFNCLHLYASSDCNGLENAVQALRVVRGFKILVGVWATPPDHFGAEKAALLSAIQRHGTDWIAAVAVGSEDLYRNTQLGQYHINPSDLANMIYDVRGMVRQFNGGIKVGHADTWTAWVDPVNDVVTRACDIAITNGFPYWEGASIDQAVKYNVYQSSLWRTQARVSAVNRGCEVWVGETGWPTSGANFGAAKPARWHLEKYYRKIFCWLASKRDLNFFWYTAFDNLRAGTPVEQSFGIAYYNRRPKFKLPRC